MSADDHPRPAIQSRLDTVFTLRDMTLPDLRAMATWRGLSAKGSRWEIIVTLYQMELKERSL